MSSVKGVAGLMTKYKLISLIPILSTISGVSLIIYGLLTGANVVNIVSRFIFRVSTISITLNDFYVILGIMRLVFGIGERKSNHKGVSGVIIGIFFVFSSISGITMGMLTSGITTSNVYGIVIDFIVMSALSLFYLVYVLKSKNSPKSCFSSSNNSR